MKKKSLFRKWMKGIALTGMILVGGFSAFYFGTSYGYSLRILAAETIIGTQHGHLAKYVTLLPDSTLNGIKDQIFHPKYQNSVTALTAQVATPLEDPTVDIRVETIKKRYSATDYYVGKLMFISNPLDVKLVTSQQKDHGEQIDVLAKREHALGAINAGGFLDTGGVGNGGTADGIVITDGQSNHLPCSTSRSCPNPLDAKDYVAGILSDGSMVTGYYSTNELLKLGTQYAAGFRPQLIVNGKKMITEGDGGWGVDPRTAIGQRPDGTIIFLEIDGRQVGYSIGATLKEVQDILYDQGCTNAMAMDGGGSSAMIVNGKQVTIPSSQAHFLRWLPNAWVVAQQPGEKVNMTVDGQKVDVQNN